MELFKQKIGYELLDKIYERYIKLINEIEILDEKRAKIIIQDQLKLLKIQNLISTDLNVYTKVVNKKLILSWYYKDCELNLINLRDIYLIQEDTYKLFEKNYKSLTKENLIDTIKYILELLGKDHLRGMYFDSLDKVLSIIVNKAKERKIIHKDFEIYLHYKYSVITLVCKYKQYNISLEDIIDFDENNFNYIERGVVYNSLTNYGPLVKIDNNKLTITGFIDEDLDSFKYDNTTWYIEDNNIGRISLEETIIDFLIKLGITPEINKYEKNGTHLIENNIKIPKTYIKIYKSDKKIIADEFLDKNILSSSATLHLCDISYHILVSDIKGKMLNFSLIDDKGYDLVKIFENIKGSYVHIILEILR